MRASTSCCATWQANRGHDTRAEARQQQASSPQLRRTRTVSSMKRRKVGEAREPPGSSSCVISYDSLKGAVSKPRLPPGKRVVGWLGIQVNGSPVAVMHVVGVSTARLPRGAISTLQIPTQRLTGGDAQDVPKVDVQEAALVVQHQVAVVPVLGPLHRWEGRGGRQSGHGSVCCHCSMPLSRMPVDSQQFLGNSCNSCSNTLTQQHKPGQRASGVMGYALDLPPLCARTHQDVSGHRVSSSRLQEVLAGGFEAARARHAKLVLEDLKQPAIKHLALGGGVGRVGGMAFQCWGWRAHELAFGHTALHRHVHVLGAALACKQAASPAARVTWPAE